jgi:hypothetical protein
MQRGNRGSSEDLNTIKNKPNNNLNLQSLVDNMEEFLKKLTELIVKTNNETKATIQKENKEIRNLLANLIEEKKRTHTKNGKNHAEINSKRIITTLNKPTKDKLNSLQTNFQIYKQKDNKNFKEGKEKIKQWRKKLQARTNLYFRHYRNERLSELFSLEIQKDNPKVPRKFLASRSNERESEEEKLIKKQLILEKVKTEIKLQRLRSARQLEKVKSIDEEMKNYIKEKFQNEMAKSLIKEWSNECRADELKTKQKYDKKEKWFKTTWIEFTENNLKLKSMNTKTTQTYKPLNNRWNLTEKRLSSKPDLIATNFIIKETKMSRRNRKILNKITFY